jgi:hypothetical protein
MSFIEWSGGHKLDGLAVGFVIVGDSLSTTVTLKVLVAPEVEVVVTVVSPTGKNEPDAGVLVNTPQLPVEVAGS